MRRALLSLATLAILATSCGKPYLIVTAPEASLQRFSKVKVGEFSIQRYMERLKGSAKQASYEAATIEANKSVMAHVSDRLQTFVGTPTGPVLTLNAELDDLQTGSGAARGLASWGLAPAGVGEGSISYFVTLRSNGKDVATYKVITKITGGTEKAYASLGRHIAAFVFDHAE